MRAAATKLPGERLGVHIGPIGAAVPLRLAAVVAATVAVGLAGFLASLTLGQFRVPLGEVVDALLGRAGADAALVVVRLRLPRAVTAVGVGLAFGLAGALMQAIARNPLASPDLLGISTGAAVGGVTAILAGGATAAGANSYGVVPAGSLAGALGAAVIIYLVAHRGRDVAGYRLVLVGLGVQGALLAVLRWLLARADIDQASRAMVWLTGSLNGRGFEHVWWVGVALTVLTPPVLALARPYALIQYDDDTARALGVPAGLTRGALLLAAVGLTAVAAASAGPIGFVALAAPQLARRLAGTAGVPLVTSGLVGAALVVVCDLVARTAFAPVELPVGIITGAVGAPYLLWLLARTNRAGTGG